MANLLANLTLPIASNVLSPDFLHRNSFAFVIFDFAVVAVVVVGPNPNHLHNRRIADEIVSSCSIYQHQIKKLNKMKSFLLKMFIIPFEFINSIIESQCVRLMFV